MNATIAIITLVSVTVLQGPITTGGDTVYLEYFDANEDSNMITDYISLVEA